MSQPYVAIPNAAEDNTTPLALYGYLIPDTLGRPYLHSCPVGGTYYRINTDTNIVDATASISSYAAFLSHWAMGADGKLYHNARIMYGQSYLWQFDPITLTHQRMGAPGGAFNTIAILGGIAAKIITYNHNGLLRVAMTDNGSIAVYDPTRPNPDSPNYNSGSAMIGHIYVPTSGQCLWADKNGILWSLTATTAYYSDLSTITGWEGDFFGNQQPVRGYNSITHHLNIGNPIAVIYDSETHHLFILDTIRLGWLEVDMNTWTEVGFLGGSWCSGGIYGSYSDHSATIQGFVANKIFMILGTAENDDSTRYFSKLTVGPGELAKYHITDWFNPPGRVTSLLYHADSNSVFVHSGSTVYRLFLADEDNQPSIFIST